MFFPKKMSGRFQQKREGKIFFTDGENPVQRNDHYGLLSELQSHNASNKTEKSQMSRNYFNTESWRNLVFNKILQRLFVLI